MTVGSGQAEHYDHILDEYDQHYFDRYSLEYRERFILGPLLDGVDLSGQRVADLAAGSGETSLYLARRYPNIQLSGFDISPEACRRYEEKVGKACRCLDLTGGVYDGERFDAAVIMGGLHHCAANLPATLTTVASMLRPGGLFLMFEPNAEYALEALRQVWYRFDRYFDKANESALSHARLVEAAGRAFNAQRVVYFGGPAFFLVLNSLVFRIPLTAKTALSPALLQLEALYNRLPSKYLFASFLARWVRA